MPPTPPPTSDERPLSTDAASSRERRSNHGLRELVDEMLASIRVAANHDLWTPEERARCEADLARIMDRVRTEATRDH